MIVSPLALLSNSVIVYSLFTVVVVEKLSYYTSIMALFPPEEALIIASVTSSFQYSIMTLASDNIITK